MIFYANSTKIKKMLKSSVFLLKFFKKCFIMIYVLQADCRFASVLPAPGCLSASLIWTEIYHSIFTICAVLFWRQISFLYRIINFTKTVHKILFIKIRERGIILESELYAERMKGCCSWNTAGERGRITEITVRQQLTKNHTIQPFFSAASCEYYRKGGT